MRVCHLSTLLILAAVGTPATASPALALTDGVRWLPGSFAAGRQPDGNSVLFDGPSGTLLVDTGRHIEHTQAALAAAGSAGPAAVLVTHWHLDHLGGVALLRAQRPAVPVLGSAAVAPALSGWLARSARDIQAALDTGQVDASTRAMMHIDLALIAASSRLRPDQVISAPQSLDSIGRPLSIGIETHAATSSDLWVWDPASRVLAAGDLVTLPVPFLDTACAPGWQVALGHLAALPWQWLVPGHGAPMARADFERWRNGFDHLLACAATDAAAEACTDGWITDLGPLLPAAEHRRTRGMLAHYLSESLRAPLEQRESRCR